MSKSKKRSIDEIEDLKREIKERDEVIKSLKRQVRREEKREKKEYSQTKLIEEEHEDKTRCPNCGKGRIKTTDLGAWKLESCTLNCKYRKTIK